MDPKEPVRAEFIRELCRGLEETGPGAGGGGVGAQGGGGGGGPSSLRFMAYLCLVATEVRGVGQERWVPPVPNVGVKGARRGGGRLALDSRWSLIMYMPY